MSDFKIIGNPNPVVGVLEFYTVSDFFSQISPSQEFVYIPKSPENQIKWEVYVLEFGKWRKTKENDKTGKQVTYTFFEKSLTRKGIRLLARKGDKVARLDIKPLAAHPKIDHVELLDKNGSKITGRLAYGQTVKARVFCLNMEKRRVHVTLWEDDVKGAGHSKANEKNFIETRSAIVNFGKADIDFLLKPSFAKIATKGGPENDKIHEYYVTAEYDREKTASNNVNVNAPETPVAPYKGKTTQKATVVTKSPAKQPKTELPKSDKPNAPAEVKGKINSVTITDTSGNAIKGRFREKQIKVWINSNNLIGKEARLKLFDDDFGKDDLLFHQEFIIQSDFHAIEVPLDTIPRSWGGNYLEEGNEQELFAEVEVLQTHAFTKSAIVDVDASVFKQDPFEIFNKVFKVDMPDKKEKKDETLPKLVIFPLLVKPENDKENKWGKDRNWTAKQGANMTTFNSNRSHGKRKHAGRDLYTNPLTEVVAIADGIVLSISDFYCETHQVSIRHTLSDGRDFIIRYGELDPKSITVKIGNKVSQKQIIGKTGKLLEYIEKTGKYIPTMKIDNVIVYMLHFEYFSGTAGFDLNQKSLTNSTKPFQRRSDLLDSLSILKEGYKNSFNISIESKDQEEELFDEEDARMALLKIFKEYGEDIAIIIEKMYRLETTHFSSKQYQHCGTGGMEVFGQPPYYGWDPTTFKNHPEYSPIGTWSAMEGKGLDGKGGNAQQKDKPKTFVMLPSVLAGMIYKAEYINRYNGNYACWYNKTDAVAQEKYRESLKGIIPRIVRTFK